MSEPVERLVPLTAAAKAAGVSWDTVAALIDSGKVPAYRPRKRRLVRASDVVRAVEGSKLKGTES